uniref:collagen alpha-2(I) chain-like n=1 Tax=Lonchura striata TaxID=40157 RepID=UPI000B4C803C|nr:collagen alpha-2(I) chain-like [Lonchura striata domestica]
MPTGGAATRGVDARVRSGRARGAPGRSRGGAGGRKGQSRARRTKPGARGVRGVSRRDGAGGGAGLGAVPAVPGPGGAQPALRCAAAPEPGAARQHPQRSPAHHHPHGHLCLPARPAAVAERDPPGHRENAASHPVIPPGIHHPSTASVLPGLPSGTRHPGAAPDPAGSSLRYPPCHRRSGPARFSPPVPAVPPPLPSAAGDALRIPVRLFAHLCPCCITGLHGDVASSSALAGCWKSPPPSADRLLELLGCVRSKPARLPNRSKFRRG